MGHPVNGIDYVLQNWGYLQDQFPYYMFFLFTDQNPEFANFFRENFYTMDELSGSGCMFFAIAPPPPDWRERAQVRDYWRHYLANSHKNIGYDEQAVDQAARHFKIPMELLPAAVIFNDIHQDEALTIHLDEMFPREWPGFFSNLFTLFNHVQQHKLQDFHLRDLKKALNFLPGHTKKPEWVLQFAKLFIFSHQHPDNIDYQERRLTFQGESLLRRRIAYRTEYPEHIASILSSMQNEISRLGDEIAALRQEQREGFHQVNVNLERIQAVLEETVHRIEEFRGPFLERWVSLVDTAGSSEEMISIQQDLHREFDEFLLQQSNYLAQRLTKTFVTLPDCLQPVSDLLEEPTKACLLSSELLWENLREFNLPWLDFSVCGIGLWKAVEIELNRTFIDALRVHRNIWEPGAPSINQKVTIQGNVREKGVFLRGQSDVEIGEMTVTLQTGNERTGHFRGIELGKIRGLLANNPSNSLAEIISQSHLPRTANDADDSEFLIKVSEQVGVVANQYRNSHAHVRPMSSATCAEFRRYLFNSTLRIISTIGGK